MAGRKEGKVREGRKDGGRVEKREKEEVVLVWWRWWWWVKFGEVWKEKKG